jgi:hypothetical protein
LTQPFSTLPVAASGDSAAGVPGAEFAAFGNPAINAIDDVAFYATLAAGAGAVTATDDRGIWAPNGSGARELVARTGGLAPGATSAAFSALGAPVYNDNEAVAFLGTLKVAANTTGIWSNSAGLLDLVAREGTQAPGYPSGVTFAGFNSFALPDAGGVLLLATVSNGAHGIWAGSTAANLQLLVRDGALFNGKTIRNIAFLPAPEYVSGQSRGFSQATGAIVYRALFTDKSSGIIVLAGTTSHLAAETGDSAPGVPGVEFSAFGNPAINASNGVAFHATLASGGVDGSDNAGIFADGANGALELIARTGSAAPGATAPFRALSDPVYNDNAAVAFRGVLKIATGEATAATETGIWSNTGGTLGMVTREGEQAPGCPAGATFHTFTSLALPDQAGVILLATLNPNASAGVTAANRTGIWAVDTAGTLQLIVREGATIGGKTIETLSFLPVLAHIGGQSRNLAQATGDIAYQVTFTDKTSAIYVVTFQ